jgi:hypothetical protein
VDLVLSADDLKAIDAAARLISIQGDRYTAQLEALTGH